MPDGTVGGSVTQATSTCFHGSHNLEEHSENQVPALFRR